MSSNTSRPEAEGTMALAISNFAVKLLSEYTGRGPTRVRTYFEEDLITLVLRDLLPKGESALARNGRSELVLELRSAYQQTMGPDLVAGVEEVSGRQVVAFLSANHLDPDVAIESFVLAPRVDGKPSGRAAG